MKFNIFKKKKYATGGTMPLVNGITTEEYNSIRCDLQAAYMAAYARQKSCDAKPSGYMKGLKDALNIVDSVKPHTLVGGL